MQKLIYFVGVAGTGKTTVAKKVALEVPCAFLDRDTVGGRFVEQFLTAQGLDKDDRDSSFYQENLRNLEYETTKDICIENLRAGQNVFMISPFTQELKNPQYLDDLLNRAEKTDRDVNVKVVVITLQDIYQQRNRIKKRATKRDAWKLENWADYEARVNFVPEINWNLPEENVYLFDNSDALTDEKIADLVAYVKD